MIFVTGGGLGADSMNNAVANTAVDLLKRYPDLVIVHAAGRKNEHSLSKRYNTLLTIDARKRVIVKDFLSNLYHYSGAADLVITRAGATSMAEFAIQGKACIIIPNPHLTAGHQIKNAQLLAEQGAVKVVSENELKRPKILETTIVELLESESARFKLGANLHELAHPAAAAELAQLLLAVNKTP
jgi:UDP-N-acetylglucosamine--N-acetylmuramyl-(pentapeptide) pyrophosphoryl-undecaprenol N-acetylglucosamine transferase